MGRASLWKSRSPLSAQDSFPQLLRSASLFPMRSLQLVLLLVTLGVVTAPAENREAPPGPAGRVLLYSEADFHGECLIVEAGAALENLEFVNDSRGHRWNDRITSVQIEGPVILI